MQPTTGAVAWSWAGVAIMTKIVGSAWGGWGTGGMARSMAAVTGKDAVVERLASMCVAGFAQDPTKGEKLKEVSGTDSWLRVTT